MFIFTFLDFLFKVEKPLSYARNQDNSPSDLVASTKENFFTNAFQRIPSYGKKTRVHVHYQHAIYSRSRKHLEEFKTEMFQVFPDTQKIEREFLFLDA